METEINGILISLAALGILVPNNAENLITSWLLNGGGIILATLVFIDEWRKGHHLQGHA